VSPAQALLDWLDLQPGEEVLDVGCGLGVHSRAMALRGARVTGIDPEAHLLEQARLACPDGVFIAVGLLDYQPPRRFDAVFAHAVLHWIRPGDAPARRLFSLLRPCGRLAASYGARAREASNLFNYYLPDAEQCRSSFLEAGFSNLRLEQRDGGILVFATRPETA
jgi:trans-aconitate methyltransferase